MLRCSNVLILIFIPYNAGVFCCAIDLDCILTRDRVEASKKKNDFKGEVDASLGRAFMKKKNALQAMKLIALRNYTFVCYLAVTL